MSAATNAQSQAPANHAMLNGSTPAHNGVANNGPSSISSIDEGKHVKAKVPSNEGANMPPESGKKKENTVVDTR